MRFIALNCLRWLIAPPYWHRKTTDSKLIQDPTVTTLPILGTRRPTAPNAYSEGWADPTTYFRSKKWLANAAYLSYQNCQKTRWSNFPAIRRYLWRLHTVGASRRSDAIGQSPRSLPAVARAQKSASNFAILCHRLRSASDQTENPVFDALPSLGKSLNHTEPRALHDRPSSEACKPSGAPRLSWRIHYERCMIKPLHWLKTTCAYSALSDPHSTAGRSRPAWNRGPRPCDCEKGAPGKCRATQPTRLRDGYNGRICRSCHKSAQKRVGEKT